jgi:hypothetical protein
MSLRPINQVTTEDLLATIEWHSDCASAIACARAFLRRCEPSPTDEYGCMARRIIAREATTLR